MIVPLIVDEYLKPEHIDKLDGILFKASDFFTAQVYHEIRGQLFCEAPNRSPCAGVWMAEIF